MREFAWTEPASATVVALALLLGGCCRSRNNDTRRNFDYFRTGCLIATVAIAFIIHSMATPVPGIGIAVPVFAPVVATAILAFVLSREYAPPLAYIGGSMGTLIGADLLNLDKISGLGAPVASIGGAGTFDGIFLTGILAVLLAGIASPSRPRAVW